MYKLTDSQITKILETAIVVVDTREQKNNHITDWFVKKGINWSNEKLDYGDYTLKLKSQVTSDYVYCNDIVTIERKANLEELSGNLTRGRDRFTNEFLRAEGKLYLLIENANYEDIERKNYNTKFNTKAFRQSLNAFEQRYNLHIHYQKNKLVSGYFIYETLMATVKEILKQGHRIL